MAGGAPEAAVVAVFQIQVLLEINKHSPDALRPSQINHRIRDGVPIHQPQQKPELLLIQFLNADADVVRQDEVEKDTLLAAELRANDDLGSRGAFFA